MPWFEETFSGITREVHRLIAKVRPILRQEWMGKAGRQVRKTVTALSEFASEHDVTPGDLARDAIELGRHKLEGWAEHERAGAVQKFAETEKLDIEAERLRRTLDATVRKETAEARLKEIEVLRAELAFLEELKRAGVVIRMEKQGQWTVLPSPTNSNILELADPFVALEGKGIFGIILDEPERSKSNRSGLVNVMERLELNRDQLSKLAGLDIRTIARAEKNQHSVTHATKIKIVAAINTWLRNKGASLDGKSQVSAADVFKEGTRR
jgi:hypothetical protein